VTAHERLDRQHLNCVLCNYVILSIDMTVELTQSVLRLCVPARPTTRLGRHLVSGLGDAARHMIQMLDAQLQKRLRIMYEFSCRDLS
jgi:hypothetical protein